LIEAGFSIL